jgi:molybdopterin/thiamine biosynthesis adenylyltransferase/rhodanese-related sulfurtransferase
MSSSSDPIPSAGDHRGRELPGLDPEEMRRYGRHLILPEVGAKGQRRLKASRVLLIGAGGLGSPLAMYLAAAGVGTLGIVDFDVVDRTNLHRQLLHGTDDIGRHKLDSSVDTLRRVNPHVTVEPHPLRLDAANALDLVSRYDVVADGSDNFATRYLVNDACVMAGRPDVWGAVFQFEGQVSVFAREEGPCYRCLYPEPPPPGAVVSCAEGGVLGVLPGIIGLMQANEVLKLLLDVGEPLVGRLLLFDALAARFREVRLARDPRCRLCGDAPTLTELVEYADYCLESPRRAHPEAARTESPAASPLEITVHELARRRHEGTAPPVLDVRLPEELAIVRMEGAIEIPLHELPRRYTELDAGQEIAIICHTGIRSLQAARFLADRGFARPRSLEGGIDMWAAVVETHLPRY